MFIYLRFFQAQTLNEKVQLLLDMNMKRSVLKFNGNKFKDFVKSAPRNYSMIIMFTAMVWLYALYDHQFVQRIYC